MVTYQAIEITEGNEAWIMPSTYLPSGEYTYNNWWDGDMDIAMPYDKMPLLCTTYSGVILPGIVRLS